MRAIVILGMLVTSVVGCSDQSARSIDVTTAATSSDGTNAGSVIDKRSHGSDSTNRSQAGEVSKANLRFEVVMLDPNDSERLSDRQQFVSGFLSKEHGDSPRQIFQTLRNSSRTEKKNLPISGGDYYCAGQLSGLVLDCDSFEVLRAEQVHDRATFTIAHQREYSELEPAAAKAYFSLKLDRSIGNVTIRFEPRGETVQLKAYPVKDIVQSISAP